MALSNAERQRRYRQRIKEKASRNEGETLREAVTAYAQKWRDSHGESIFGEAGNSVQDDVDEIMSPIKDAVMRHMPHLTEDDPADKELLASINRLVT